MTPPDDLALPRLKAFVQRRGGQFWSYQNDHIRYCVLFPRALDEDEVEELFRLSDSARVENLAVIGPAEECGA